MILLYSSIVGYGSLAIISLGRGISIYGGLFHLQFGLIINYIKSFSKIGFSNPKSYGLTLLNIARLLVILLAGVYLNIYYKVLGLSKNWFNKLKVYLPLVTHLVGILIEEIELLLKPLPYHTSVVWCGAPKKEEGLILNLNSNSKSAPGFPLSNVDVSGKERWAAGARLSPRETSRRLKLILDS